MRYGLLILTLMIWGCGNSGGEEGSRHPDYFADLQEGATQRSILCSRPLDDRFMDWYCGPDSPEVPDLSAMLTGLQFQSEGGNPTNFAVTGHSSSLVSRLVTSLNPRVIHFTPMGTEDFLMVGFMRGENLVEAVAWDRTREDLNFYLLGYELACGTHCTNAERFLPQNEVNWLAHSVYSDEDLSNTVVDCIRCHSDGTGQKRYLRMQELPVPWTHWFHPFFGSKILLEDFQAAHVAEEYGGVPTDQMDRSAPQVLEILLNDAGDFDQPNIFNGTEINQDNPNVYEPTQPWLDLYQRAIDGEIIPPPYFGISPFDPSRVRSFSQTYRDVVSGEADPSRLPDMTTLFKPNAFRYLSFKPAEGLEAKQLVTHACGQCHGGKFPNTTRNRFNAFEFPDNLTPTIASRVRDRLKRHDSDPQKMPPVLGMRLSERERDIILDALP